MRTRTRSLLATITLAMTFALFLGTHSAEAAVFRSGDQVTIAENETINDDLYISGGQIQIDGTISGDVVAAGGTINISGGDIKGSLIAAGGQININGNIARSARVAGGNISVAGTIGRDLVAAGGTTSIASGASIAGDLVIGTGSAAVIGTIGKRIIGGIGVAEINGAVGRSVFLDVDKLSVGPDAKIGGDLEYRSENPAEISGSAEISGATQRSMPPIERRKIDTGAAKSVLGFLSFVWMLAMGSVILALFPRSRRESSKVLLEKPWQSLGVGFLVLIAVPPAIIILLISVLGIPLALLSLFLYIFLIYLAKVFVGLFLGDQVLRRIRGKESHWFWSLLVGLVLFLLVGLIPVISGLVGFAVVLFGLGAMAYTFLSLRKRDPEPPTAPKPPTPAAKPE